jgi:putative DNA primase/helicase
MELYESWLNVSADIPSDMIENLGTFKMLVGKDRVAAEMKGVQEKVKFIPTTKHVFSANQLPEVYDADDAFWRRILIVPFPETIPRDERMDNFDEKLLEDEVSGILNWILEGYKRLLEEGGFTADRTPDETKKLWMSWSTSVIRFYARCLRDDFESSEPVGDVYDAYTAFCKDEGLTPVGKVAFGKRLTKFPHIDSVQSGGGHQNQKHYSHIRLREDLK